MQLVYVASTQHLNAFSHCASRLDTTPWGNLLDLLTMEEAQAADHEVICMESAYHPPVRLQRLQVSFTSIKNLLQGERCGEDNICQLIKEVACLVDDDRVSSWLNCGQGMCIDSHLQYYGT